VVDEAKIDICYENNKIGNGFIDLLVNEQIVLEFKSKGFINQSDFKQLRTYLQC
jgi:GxxExxY protein